MPKTRRWFGKSQKLPEAAPLVGALRALSSQRPPASRTSQAIPRLRSAGSHDRGLKNRHVVGFSSRPQSNLCRPVGEQLNSLACRELHVSGSLHPPGQRKVEIGHPQPAERLQESLSRKHGHIAHRLHSPQESIVVWDRKSPPLQRMLLIPLSPTRTNPPKGEQ
jgi:hypothetical protein